ncbi:ABC transporter substrate-binding protein [Calothrix sp. FACHB-1219]|uniref:ABC transporter substrate-binding protein n=1 Tax=unclassified Calothrix TaxID=2619626 RepID=UPI001684F37F|nr:MULTISPECIES: ABC transporter substrate-binding protein [unclassified Calothrix]MBD2202976.1 ABC transporter substrate-binding protein [Calothrix sp. FACHB-168]MBD2216104.1 ABC transporter substrate-binding protein [Calothrix sp. FACHB-1219]
MMLSSSSIQPPQNVAVVLEISSGSFDDGFCVRVQIFEDGKIIDEHYDLTEIPPASLIPKLYENWQDILLENSRTLQAVPGQVTNVALDSWKQRAKELEDYCKNWFQNPAFKSLRDRIQANIKVKADQSVPIIIRCHTANHRHNDVLRRLPWHIWDLFSKLPNTEFALFTKFHNQVATFKTPVKVLAIFGSSQGNLQLEADKEALKLLEARGARITWKVEPTEEEIAHLLFDNVWDILFFAGHSSSEVTGGKIQISQDRFLPLEALTPSLRRAVSQGLKLAIFNSCDGLGIADFLTQLNVPASIVMREPVPDRIAGQFLLYFLRQFSQGIPLCLAVREARDRLDALKATFPTASWLPVVCLNPNQPEFVWPTQTSEMIPNPSPPPPPFPLLKKILGLAAVVGIIAATLIYINRCSIFSSSCKPPGNDETIQPKIDNLISLGEKAIADSTVKLSQPYLGLKEQGIKEFAQGDYESAYKTFDSLRFQAGNNKKVQGLRQTALAALQDPEVLIYRNNAFVNTRHKQNPIFPIYTIAVAAPLNVNSGLDILFGVAQAQDVAVKNGINLQVVIANDLNQQKQAQQIATKLSQNQKILAVVGHYTSPNTCEALKVYSPNELVLISPTSTVLNLQSCATANKVFFRTTTSTRDEAKSLVQYLVNDLRRNQPKVVIFYSKEWFSRDLTDEFEKVIQSYQGKILLKVDLSDPNFDASKLPSEVQEADALVLLPDGGTDGNKTLENAIKIIKLNNGKKPILGANTLYLQEVINQAKAATKSLFLASEWHPKQCGAQDFAKQINEYWGGDLNRRVALSYEAVQAIVQAIRNQAVGKPIDRKTIQQKLSETGINPNKAASSDVLKGWKIIFKATGDREGIDTQPILTVKEHNQQLKFDFAKNIPCQ